MTIPTTGYASAAPLESSASAVSWAPVIAGAVAATAITLILLLVGSGLGLTMVSPWANASSSAATVGVAAAVWLIVIQWLSAGVGGYLTGRLRTKWTGVHTYEVFFRDTAHGFLSWALATIVVAGLLSSAVSSVIGTGVQATAAVAGGAAATAGSAAASGASQSTSTFSPAYYTDALLRPSRPQAAPGSDSNENVTAEVSRILLTGAADGGISPDDRTYLQQVVASRAGLSDADAKARVDTVLKRIDDAKVATQQAADKARKSASVVALLGALSLLVGAFIAGVGGAIGGRQRDEDEERMALNA